MRLSGALAIWFHSSEYQDHYTRLNRLNHISANFTDIDFIGYQNQASRIRKLFENQLNFQVDKHVLFLHRKQQLLYYLPENLYHVDIFIESLNFSQQIFYGSDPKKGAFNSIFPLFLWKTSC